MEQSDILNFLDRSIDEAFLAKAEKVIKKRRLEVKKRQAEADDDAVWDRVYGSSPGQILIATQVCASEVLTRVGQEVIGQACIEIVEGATFPVIEVDFKRQVIWVNGQNQELGFDLTVLSHIQPHVFEDVLRAQIAWQSGRVI